MKGFAACLALAALGLPAAGARAREYYVDPGAPGNTGGSGTLENPYRSWKSVRFSSGNKYLQRRGTVEEIEALSLGVGAEDVTIGAYGQGPRPKVVASTRRYAVTGGRCTNVTVRDLEVAAESSTSCITFGASTNVTIDNCVVHGAIWGIRFTNAPSTGHKVFRTEVYDIGDDGMFIQDTTDLEIAHCNVHHVNTRWVEPYTPQTKASGDAIQLHRCNDWHLHHNTLDRTNSGNKFCFIASGEEQTQGVFEYNVLSGPKTTGDGGSSVYFGSGANLIVRYNLIQGPTPGGVYHHSSNLKVYGNVFVDLSGGVTSLTDSPCEVYDNILHKVSRFLRGNNDARNNRAMVPTVQLYRSMGLPGYEPEEPECARVVRRREPYRPKPKPRKTLKPEAMREWDARLLARLKEEVLAGKTVEFSLQAFQQQVTVVSITDEDVIRVKSDVTEADMGWSRLALPDRRSMARALVREGVAEDHGLLAFYLMAEGDEEGARDHMAKAGELAQAVSDSFTTPGAVAVGPADGQAGARDRPPPREVARSASPGKVPGTGRAERSAVESRSEETEAPPPDPGLASLYKAAEGAFVDGDVEEAERLFRSIADDHPGTDYARKAAEFLAVLE